MDPNTLLSRLREFAELVADHPAEVDPEAYELANAFQNLDTWLTRGGFKPSDWA